MPNHNNTLFEYTTKTIILCSGPLKVVSTHKQLTLIIVVFLLLCFSLSLFVLSLLFSRFIRLLQSLSLQGPILFLIVFQYIYVFVVFIIIIFLYFFLFLRSSFISKYYDYYYYNYYFYYYYCYLGYYWSNGHPHELHE